MEKLLKGFVELLVAVVVDSEALKAKVSSLLEGVESAVTDERVKELIADFVDNEGIDQQILSVAGIAADNDSFSDAVKDVMFNGCYFDQKVKEAVSEMTFTTEARSY